MIDLFKKEEDEWMRRRLARLLALAPTTSVMTLPTMGAQAYNGAHADNSLYELVVDTPLNWNSANAAARRRVAPGCRTAHLATITSPAEQEVVDELMAGVDRNAWLGGHQGGLSLDENWLWVTGEPFDYENWGGGEPNDMPAGVLIPGSEQHLETLGVSGKWNDAPGSEEKFFIVESEHCS